MGSVIDTLDSLTRLEERFCRDFTCCERRIATLHQLLVHVDHCPHVISPQHPVPEAEELAPFVMARRFSSDSVPDTLLKPKDTAVEAAYLLHGVPYMIRRQDPPMTVDPQDVMAIQMVDREETPSEASYADEDLPFKCMVEGCHRSYKNRNGLKYHYRQTHHSTISKYHALSIAAKHYPCGIEDCTNIYTTLGGLKYHVETKHGGDVSGLSLIKGKKASWKKKRTTFLTPPTTPEMSFSVLG